MIIGYLHVKPSLYVNYEFYVLVGNSANHPYGLFEKGVNLDQII